MRRCRASRAPRPAEKSFRDEPLRGLQQLEHGGGNFLLPAFPGLILKDSYWRWPQRNLAGNAIDFHTQVLGLSFQQAMQHITGITSSH